MQDIEFYPRYMAHQLRTHLPATVVGRLVETDSKRNSLLLQTDAEGTFVVNLAKLMVQGIIGEQQDLSQFVSGKFYQIRGMCRSGKQIEVHGSTCFGGDFGNYKSMQTW